MKISLNKKIIVDEFLTPISRITEECSIHITPDSIYSLVNDLSGNVILYCNLTIKTNVEKELVLNIKDVRKLCKVFDCIESAIIDLDVDENSSVIKYSSPHLSFKLHLVNESVIRKCTVSLDKISKLTSDNSFNITGDKLNDLLRGSIFSTETNKIYFYTQGEQVYAELTDKATQDVDSITFMVTDKIEGDRITTPLPFNMEILRFLAASKPSNIEVKINNTYKILTFTIKVENSEIKYIIPAFVK
jgi:hypothetical protein